MTPEMRRLEFWARWSLLVVPPVMALVVLVVGAFVTAQFGP